MESALGSDKKPSDPEAGRHEGSRPQDAPADGRAERIEAVRRRCNEGSESVPSRNVADRIIRKAVERIRKRQK